MARKILLADDSVTAQNMGRKILADAGYEVITVNNGSAALKKIAEHKPDLIVLDVYMPGYSGLEVCQRLKEAGETSRVPVLLTVGKLEPFKPEEAKRVRADAFIVKPFEASELLSALSKLEDKIVPRSEASKPGRFARATQAIEEGRYDKTVAVDEDSGWRNRIAFPSKKKEKEKAAQEQENGDEAGIYNAMNKDLRTVVEHKLAEHPQEAKVDEERVDLGALAPEGLPKDVTPEEIAALAAAAAQVKGKIAESHTAEPVAEPKAEHKSEVEEQAQSQAPQPTPEVVSQAATFAEQKSEEKSEEKVESKIEASAEKSGDAVQEPASIPTPSSSDVMAAIIRLESDAAESANSGNGSWSHSSANHTADEPITMAAAAGAGNVAADITLDRSFRRPGPGRSRHLSRTRDAPGVRGLRRCRDGSCGTGRRVHRNPEFISCARCSYRDCLRGRRGDARLHRSCPCESGARSCADLKRGCQRCDRSHQRGGTRTGSGSGFVRCRAGFGSGGVRACSAESATVVPDAPKAEAQH